MTNRINICWLDFVIPLFFFRFFEIYQFFSNQILGLALIRGFLSDLSFSILPLIFFLIFRNYSKILVAGLWLVWLFILTGNHLHIFYNQSHMHIYEFTHAITPAFVKGNVLTLELLVVGLIAGLSSKLVTYFIADNIHQNLRLPSLLILTGIVGCFFLPTRAHLPDWLQKSLGEVFAQELVARIRPNTIQHGLPTISPEQYQDPFFQKNLSGEIISSISEKPEQNVLLIIVEGLSSRGINPNNTPYLDALKTNASIFIPDFLALQFQTNRGLYALLCGDLPNIANIETKADRLAQFPDKNICLPKRLNREGYATVFMQSAPLGFMRKDRFGQAAGFDEIFGTQHFKFYHALNGWGVDDLALFQHAFTKIEELSKNKPWFMTLLTVGMHPPYLVPESHNPDFEDALHYADSSLQKFVAELEELGILKDTLVLITSDEAQQNQSVLIALNPLSKEHYLHERLFHQSDLALSIQDYLGLESAPTDIGRSFFREYSSDRESLFGSVYANRIYHHINGRLINCTPSFQCQAKQSKIYPDSIGPSVAISESEIGRIKNLVHLADNKLFDHLEKVLFLEENRIYKQNSTIIGGHKVQIRSGDEIELTIDLETNAPLNISIKLFFLDKWAENPDVNPYHNRGIFHQSDNISANEPYHWTRTLRFETQGILVTHIDAAFDSSGQDNLFELNRLSIFRLPPSPLPTPEPP